MLTASGPLRATLFLSMLSIVSSGITVLPSFSRGVTSTGSHLIGVYKAMSVSFRGEINSANHTLAALKMSFTDWAISGPMPSPSIRLTV